MEPSIVVSSTFEQCKGYSLKRRTREVKKEESIIDLFNNANKNKGQT